MLGVTGTQIFPHFTQYEAVSVGQRQHNGVLSRGCLQFKIKSAAKAFAQRQAPSAVDAAAIRRMQHQLHTTRLVEKPLQHQEGVSGRQRCQRGTRGGQVFRYLMGGVVIEAEVLEKPVDGMFNCFRAIIFFPEQTVNLTPQSGDAKR